MCYCVDVFGCGCEIVDEEVCGGDVGVGGGE